jgi:glucose/arabinose dehydrogenase
VPVAGGFQRPTTVTHAGDGSRRLFVVERDGTIRVVTDAGHVLPDPFLDIRSIVGSDSIEQGLLGLAFDPGFGENGYFYVAYTDLLGDSMVARYRVSADDPNRADPGSASLVLELPQPSPIHNIHELMFGPDGYLYVGSGDGGPAGDPDGRAEALDGLYGKLLRLDVDPESFPAGYGIPPDNPFVGVPGARDEIWALGLRNPANISFDRREGDLLIADVGQDLWEEVDFEPSASPGGRNYGWSTMEGFHCFDPPVGCDMSGRVLPVAEYPQNVQGDCAVIGGYVYRGEASPALHGWYLFGDFCSGTLRGVRPGCGGWKLEILRPGTFRISALGEDEAGEIYAAEWSTDGSSVLYRLAAVPSPVVFRDGFESAALTAWSSCAR